MVKDAIASQRRLDVGADARGTTLLRRRVLETGLLLALASPCAVSLPCKAGERAWSIGATWVQEVEPFETTVDREGWLWVWERKGNRVLRIDPERGPTVTIAVSPGASEFGADVFGALIVEPGGRRVSRYGLDGRLGGVLSLPYGVTSVAWVDATTVAVGPGEGPELVGIWTLDGKKLLGIPVPGDFPKVPADVSLARKTALFFDSQERLLRVFDQLFGELATFALSGRRVSQFGRRHADTERVLAWARSHSHRGGEATGSSSRALSAGGSTDLEVFRVYPRPTVNTKGDLLVSSACSGGRLGVLVFGARDLVVSERTVVLDCCVRAFEALGEIYYFYREPETGMPGCKLLRRLE